jgi:hypothetical protein
MCLCTLLQKWILPCWDNSPFLCFQLWLWWLSGALFLTIWGLVWDNSIPGEVVRSPFPWGRRIPQPCCGDSEVLGNWCSWTGNWEWMKHVWDTGQVWSPNPQFPDVQVTTYSLMSVHMDLIGGLYWPAYCQVAPPTGYCPRKELVRDGRSVWGSVLTDWKSTLVL